MANRPFYRYSGLNELIGFKEYYGLPRGHEHSHILASIFTRSSANFSLSFLEKDCNNLLKKIVVPCLDVIMIAFFPRNIH